MSDKKVIILDEETVHEKTDGLGFLLGEADEKIKQLKETIQESKKSTTLTKASEEAIAREMYRILIKAKDDAALKMEDVNAKILESAKADFSSATSGLMKNNLELIKVAINNAVTNATKEAVTENKEAGIEIARFTRKFDKLIEAIESMNKLAPASADNEQLTSDMEEMKKKLNDVHTQMQLYTAPTEFLKKTKKTVEDSQLILKQIQDAAGTGLKSFGIFCLGVVLTIGTLYAMQMMSK